MTKVSVIFCWLLSFWWAIASTTSLASAASSLEWEAVNAQNVTALKAMLTELGIPFDYNSPEKELRQIARDEKAVNRWLEIHSEEAKKIRKAERERLMREKEILQKKLKRPSDDLSEVKDPEKLQILSKLRDAGIRLEGGTADRPIEQLRRMESLIFEKVIPSRKKPSTSEEL